MAELDLGPAIERFTQNENRMDRFTNGTSAQTFITSDGAAVPTIRKFLADKDTEINTGAGTILADAVAARDAAEGHKEDAETAAAAAAQSAEDAALFDPSSYYVKTTVDAFLDEKADDVATTNALALKQDIVSLAFGQGRLTLSGGNLVYGRFNGRLTTINGVHEVVPSAGVSLAPTGLTPATLYYIYAYMNDGTMTLEASATAYAVDSTTGVVIKSGDATRTLVGMAYPETGPVFTNTVAKRFVRSWFNDSGVSLQNNFTANRATSSPHTTPQEVNTEIRCQFLLWAGERAEATIQGSFTNGAASGGQTTSLGFNTTSTPEAFGVVAIVAAGEVIPFSCGTLKEGLSEGLNFVTLLGWVTASGGNTFYGDANGRRTSLRCRVGR